MKRERDNAADLAGARRRNHKGNGQRSNHTPIRQYIVVFEKSNGLVREYGRYDERPDADRIAGLLSWAGAVARVEQAR